MGYPLIHHWNAMLPKITDDISTPINISVMSLLKLYNLCQVLVNRTPTPVHRAYINRVMQIAHSMYIHIWTS